MKIICGPAIRRVEKNVAYIWLLTDARPQNIKIYANTSDTINENSHIAMGLAEGVDVKYFGEHLYAALIAVRPDNAEFPFDAKIFYNIIIDGHDLDNLDEQKLISGKNRIVYGNDIYPSFYIPTKHHKIIQGSCRKPHAAKDPRAQFDQINKIDSDINSSFSKSINNRPSMLCLTGDQIYADDVTESLASMLKVNARNLTGWDESLPSGDENGVVFPSQLKLGNRDDTLTSENGFTSSHSKNHLMSFGEYAAMYIAAWGGMETNVPTYAEIISNMGTKVKKIKRAGKFTVNRTVAAYDQDEYAESKKILELFLKTSWKMRRIMANTVTYMMFDDHEVTDDWNLTKENYHLLRTNPLSKRIQANALAAYWLFQGWGNNPEDEDFGSGFINTLSHFFQSQSHENGNDFESALLEKKYWGYEVAGYPYLVSLDTRTDRVFDDESDFSQLMSSDRLQTLGERFKDINTQYGDEQSMLIISPAPILGFSSIECLQLLFDFIPNTLDGEPWIGSATAYENLCNALSNIKFKHCSVFSGDVHYSLARRQKIEREDNHNGPLLLNQYTSSALYNWPSGTARILLSTLSDVEKVRFHKNNTPYLYPNNLTYTDEFLSGHPSYGLLEFKKGVPVKNTYYFKDTNNKESYHWIYNVAKPKELNFSYIDVEDEDDW